MERIISDKQLFRDRGVFDCIKAAYWSIEKNIKVIVKAIFVPSVVLIIFGTIYNLAEQYQHYGFSNNIIMNFFIQNSSFLKWISIIGILILIVPFFAELLCIYNGKKIRWNSIRFSKLYLLNSIIIVIHYGIFLLLADIDWDGGELLFYAIILVLIIFMAPFICYSYIKYLFDEKINLSQLFSSYSVGFEYMFDVVCVIIVPYILFRFFSFLLIERIRNIWNFAHEAEIVYDIFVGVLVSITAISLTIWLFTVNCFLYGSIESREYDFNFDNSEEDDEINGEDIRFIGM